MPPFMMPQIIAHTHTHHSTYRHTDIPSSLAYLSYYNAGKGCVKGRLNLWHTIICTNLFQYTYLQREEKTKTKKKGEKEKHFQREMFKYSSSIFFFCLFFLFVVFRFALRLKIFTKIYEKLRMFS